jgi:hypothetical protein
MSPNRRPTSDPQEIIALPGCYAEAAQAKIWAIRDAPDKNWANRTLAVSLARVGETTAAREALLAFRRYAPDVTIVQVMKAVPFSADFQMRLANGLDDLGLPAVTHGGQ